MLNQFRRQLVDRLLPLGTPRRRVVGRLLNRLRGRDVPRETISYPDWIRRIEPRTVTPVRDYSYKPLISLVVPGYNPPDRYLHAMIDSVLAQTYPNWELVLVQGSTQPDRIAAIRAAAGLDSRIRIIENPTSDTSIVANTNLGIDAAKGEYIAFMDQDDTLAPLAFNEIVAALQDRPEIDFIYTDEDKLSDDGRHRSLPLFKPDWSPALMTTVNYCSHINVVRRTLVIQAGRLRPGFDGAQDYDFMLRVLTANPTVHHIPKVLYHWRQAAGSTAIHPDQKAYVEAPAKKALEEHAHRNHIDATVQPVPNMPTTYRYHFTLSQEPKILVHLTAPDPSHHFATIKSATTYTNWTLPSVPVQLDQLAPDDFILFLDPELTPEHPDWLAELASVAIRRDRGLVAGWIRTPDTRTAAGSLVLQHGKAVPLFAGALPATWYHNGHALWPRNTLMVTPRCLLVSAANLKRFYSSTHVAPTDLLVLGIQLHQAGLFNTFWPYARLQTSQPISSDPILLPPQTLARDPFFSPNLTVTDGTIELSQ